LGCCVVTRRSSDRGSNRDTPATSSAACGVRGSCGCECDTRNPNRPRDVAPNNLPTYVKSDVARRVAPRSTPLPAPTRPDLKHFDSSERTLETLQPAAQHVSVAMLSSSCCPVTAVSCL
jgi:hypothetical protein